MAASLLSQHSIEFSIHYFSDTWVCILIHWYSVCERSMFACSDQERDFMMDTLFGSILR